MLIRFEGVVKDIPAEYAMSLVDRGLAEKVEKVETTPKKDDAIIRKEQTKKDVK
jgi:hypothetical protein